VALVTTGEVDPLSQAVDYNSQPLSGEFESALKNTGSAAFIVLRDGELVAEHYFNGYDDRSKTNSFSLAKTVLTMLVGIAIEEGIIESLDQPITDYLPEFADDELGKTATLANLSLMNSGYDWVEHYYSWFSPTVELYHGSDVESFLLGRGFSDVPNERWYYSSASTQLLASALSRALEQSGRSSRIVDYLSEKIWQPLGMNDDALWHTDDEGMELAYCCLNSNARNFAKLGQLMLNNGRWSGRQVVPEAFIRKMIQPDGQHNYGYSTWLNYDNNPPFYHFSGHLGQSITVVPEHKLVVVRLGERRDTDVDFQTEEIPAYVDEAMRLASANLPQNSGAE
jgi:CubicO group peptidase (beta-lactamase class C family)